MNGLKSKLNNMTKNILLISPADPTPIVDLIWSMDRPKDEVAVIKLQPGELPNQALRRMYGDAAPIGASIHQLRRVGTVKSDNKIGGVK